MCSLQLPLGRNVADIVLILQSKMCLSSNVQIFPEKLYAFTRNVRTMGLGNIKKKSYCYIFSLETMFIILMFKFLL